MLQAWSTTLAPFSKVEKEDVKSWVETSVLGQMKQSAVRMKPALIWDQYEKHSDLMNGTHNLKSTPSGEQRVCRHVAIFKPITANSRYLSPSLCHLFVHRSVSALHRLPLPSSPSLHHPVVCLRVRLSAAIAVYSFHWETLEECAARLWRLTFDLIVFATDQWSFETLEFSWLL